MSDYYLGIDSGATRTRAFLFDLYGKCCAMGEAGSSNPAHGNDEQVTQRLNEALDAVIGNWISLYGRPFHRSQIVVAYVGSAGFTNEAGRERMQRLCRIFDDESTSFDVGTEMRVSLFGALEGRPGISLIAGTGSACLAEDAEGNTWQCGGWENLVADEGGGYWLGLQGMIAAVQMYDGRLEKTGLESVIFHELGIDSINEIIDRLHRPPIGKTEVAALAKPIVEKAEQGDQAALDIVSRGCAELARMVEASHRCLPTASWPEVAVVGGLVHSTFYRDRLFAAIREKLPEARIGLASLPPVVGAGLLALKLVGLSPSEELIFLLRKEYGNKLV